LLRGSLVSMNTNALQIRSILNEPALLPDLAEVLVDCVEGGASVSFMWPLSYADALAFWQAAMDSAARGERILLIAQDAAGQLQGTVQVLLNLPENQPHRGDLAKMLVHRRARRSGVGAALVQAAEQAALEAGRTLLVLDTVTGGDAERLYQRLRWQRVGEIPGYALWPRGGLCSTTYYYKTLR
jgi:GNAT superfamily N-acetyltransferase